MTFRTSLRAWVGLALMVLTAPGGLRCAAAEPPGYEQRPGSPDGIGKWYLGREIAHYMTHHGASWLERPERVDEEPPDRLLAALAMGRV